MSKHYHREIRRPNSVPVDKKSMFVTGLTSIIIIFHKIHVLLYQRYVLFQIIGVYSGESLYHIRSSPECSPEISQWTVDILIFFT
jgi:hypothetical protein